MPAFPSAEGFGANATGGRQGSVVFVTTTTDSTNPGSLRHALTVATGPRTIIFRVGGRFHMTLGSLNITSGNVTCAGQTAPGGGVMITGANVNVRSSNNIFRFIRWKCGLANISKATGQDTSFYGALGGSTNLVQNNIYDHCEFFWGTDGNMSAYSNVTNITFQHCISAEGLNCGSTDPAGNHGQAGLHATQPFYGTPIRISTHHCLLAHCFDRMPLMNPYLNPSLSVLTMQYELRNNVIYNWQANLGATVFACAFNTQTVYNQQITQINWPNGTVPHQANVIGNHWIEGPNNNPGVGCVKVCNGTRLYVANSLYWPRGLANIGPLDGFGGPKVNLINPILESGTFTPSMSQQYGNYSETNYRYLTEQNFNPAVPITTQSVVGLRDTLLDGVGVKYVWRNGVRTNIQDASALRVCSEVVSRTGSIGGGLSYSQWQAGADVPYPTIANGTPYTDSNSDGIADGWSGMPVGATAQQLAPNGYTYLENFINEMAGDTVPSPDTTPPATPTGFTVS